MTLVAVSGIDMDRSQCSSISLLSVYSKVSGRLQLETHGLPVVVALVTHHRLSYAEAAVDRGYEQSLTIPWILGACSHKRMFRGASDIVTFDDKALFNFLFASRQH